MWNTPNPKPDPAWTHTELKKLWDTCFSRLFFVALAITKNPESAKDIVMKNFLKVLEGRSNIKPDENPCAQLTVWVSNDSKTYLTGKDRSDNRNQVFHDRYNAEAEPDAEMRMIRAERFNRLYKEIEKLPRECSKVLKLQFEGLSIKEIAIQLNKEERTVRSHKARGLKLLRKRLGNSDLLPSAVLLLL